MGTPSAAQKFGDALFELYDTAGCPPLSRLVELGTRAEPEIALRTSSLNDWFNGKSVPSNAVAVQLLVHFLNDQVAERGERPEILRPIEWWLGLRELAWSETHVRRGGRPRKQQDTPQVTVNIDEKRRLTRRLGGRFVTYGSMHIEHDRVAYGEGVILRVSAQSSLPEPVYITNIDLLVVKHSPVFPADYQVISLSALHYEVPSSDVGSAIELDGVALLDGYVPVIDRRLMLDPRGTVGSQHTLRCTVVAINPGLWETTLRITYFSDRSPAVELTAQSEHFLIAKR
jgi:hypothetical protein